MFTQQTAAVLVFLLILSTLGVLGWALASGSWCVFRCLIGACGLGLALLAVTLAIALALDVFGRYERAATVISAHRAGIQSASAVTLRSSEAPEQSSVAVHYAYEAEGRRRESRKYAPVDLHLQPERIEQILAALNQGKAVAYVSYFDPDDAVLHRAIGSRFGALFVAAIGAYFLFVLFSAGSRSV